MPDVILCVALLGSVMAVSLGLSRLICWSLGAPSRRAESDYRAFVLLAEAKREAARMAGAGATRVDREAGEGIEAQHPGASMYGLPPAAAHSDDRFSDFVGTIDEFIALGGNRVAS